MAAASLLCGSERLKLRGMKRLQVLLPDDNHEALRIIAQRTGRSISAVVRNAVLQALPKLTRRSPMG